MVTGWSVAAALLQTRLHPAQIADCIGYNALNSWLSLILERRENWVLANINTWVGGRTYTRYHNTKWRHIPCKEIH